MEIGTTSVRRTAASVFSHILILRDKCLELLYPSSHADVDSISLETLQFLAAGKSGIVYAIDDKRVLKEFQETERGEVERQAYCRLGSHSNIAKLLGTRKDGSIVLERGEVLRKICRSASADKIPIERKLCWLRQAAKGYQHLHNSNIIHSDVGCNNMILTKEGRLKIIDFEGCSIDVYEIITGRPPHHELEVSNDRYHLVERLYADNNFPDVTSLPLGQLIQSCWLNGFGSMSEVVRELEAFNPRSSRCLD
ncbi:hypothetical protein LOZ66_005405 [Ophidiomyces ophidiicola]|nr:hypothetical protein LOZ66_005405 [Ophidiomyces ophidiicola]